MDELKPMNGRDAQAHYQRLNEEREALQPIADSLEEEGAAMNRRILRGIGLESRGVLAQVPGLKKRYFPIRDRIIRLNIRLRALENVYGLASWRIPKPGHPILRGITLAAIVRDEMKNPAGGLIDWINSTVPYVERAVIVDTGSSDKTAEVLEQARKHFKNLEVYHTNWAGFSAARNYVMNKVETPRALILDADEIIADEFLSPSRGFGHLQMELAGYARDARIKIPVNTVYAELGDLPCEDAINPRIILAEDWFEVKDKKRDCFEYVNTAGDEGIEIRSPVAVWHFLPGVFENVLKQEHYYGDNSFMMDTPLQNAGVYGWKKFNFCRDTFRS